MNNNFRCYLFYLLLGMGLSSQTTRAQVNFFGKPGLIAIPSAEWDEKKHLGISFAYLPREYSLFDSPGNRNTLHLYNLRAGFTSFMEVNLSIAHRPLMADQIGIGDRQLDFRFRILKETDRFPAVVFGWTPPGSVSPVMAHDYLAVTKNITTTAGIFRLTAGYGSPFVFVKNDNSTGAFDLRITEKQNFQGSEYLSGFFGGLTYLPLDFAGIMLEHDSHTVNAGAFIEFWDRLILQGYTFEGKEWAFSFAANFPLDFSPRTLRRYEKNLD